MQECRKEAVFPSWPHSAPHPVQYGCSGEFCAATVALQLWKTGAHRLMMGKLTGAIIHIHRPSCRDIRIGNGIGQAGRRYPQRRGEGRRTGENAIVFCDGIQAHQTTHRTACNGGVAAIRQGTVTAVDFRLEAVDEPLHGFAAGGLDTSKSRVAKIIRGVLRQTFVVGTCDCIQRRRRSAEYRCNPDIPAFPSICRRWHRCQKIHCDHQTYKVPENVSADQATVNEKAGRYTYAVLGSSPVRAGTVTLQRYAICSEPPIKSCLHIRVYHSFDRNAIYDQTVPKIKQIKRQREAEPSAGHPPSCPASLSHAGFSNRESKR